MVPIFFKYLICSSKGVFLSLRYVFRVTPLICGSENPTTFLSTVTRVSGTIKLAGRIV